MALGLPADRMIAGSASVFPTGLRRPTATLENEKPSPNATVAKLPAVAQAAQAAHAANMEEVVAETCPAEAD